MQLRIFSVSELNNYIKRLFSVDPIMNAIRVEGEISNFKSHTSGHAYFTIKDKDSRINCVMFSSNFQRLDFQPHEGDFVEIFGRVSVYEKNGSYQLYVNKMATAGLGYLYKQFNELKLSLESEGLFDESIKRQIPDFPNKIAVITSPTGAAIKDVISVIKRRNPFVEILIVPASVQGNNTVNDVLLAFDKIKKKDDIDLVILTRGGGSYDELFNFNSELIARKIFECDKPVISAIGHEIDFTISDFVVDLRAPTPSAAAELATQNTYEKLDYAKLTIKKMKYGLLDKLSQYENNFNIFDPLKLQFNIEKRLLDALHECETFNQANITQINTKIKDKSQRFDLLIEKINSKNPITTFKRGYSQLRDKNGQLIKSIEDIKVGDKLMNEIEDGKILSVVDCVEGRNGKN